MNPARVLRLVNQMIVDLETFRSELALVEPGEVQSPWMTVPTYARYAQVHATTVRRWIHEGMGEAGAVVGKGKLTRVHREKADAWRGTRPW